MENTDSPVAYDNLDLWWAYVIHTDAKTEYAQVNQFMDWKPKKPHDFVPKHKYTLRTNKWREDGKYDRCKVYILKMGDTLAQLKQSIASKRLTVPRLEVSDGDYLSDMTDIEGTAKVTPTSGRKRPRATGAEVAAKRSKAELKDMEKFASELSNLYPDSSFPSTSSSFAPSKPIQSSTSKSSKTFHSSGDHIASKPLTSRNPSQVLPNISSKPSVAPQNNSSTSQVHSPNNFSPGTFLSHKKTSTPKNSISPNCHSTQPQVQASIKNVQIGHKKSVNSKVVRNVGLSFQDTPSAPPNATEKIYTENDIKLRDQEMERLRQQLSATQAQLAKKNDINDVILGELRNLSQRVANIEDAIQKMSDGSCSISTGQSNGYVPPKVTFENDEVHLGDGIVCTLSSWNTMSTTSDETLWGNAFVMGTFKEDAHLYGLNPHPQSGKMRFPENFKRVALLHWTDFLVRTGHKLPLSKKLLNSGLSKLSSRCHDSAGRRNTGKGGRRNTGKGKNQESTVIRAEGNSLIIDPVTGEVEDEQGRHLGILPRVVSPANEVNPTSELPGENQQGENQQGENQQEENKQEEDKQDEDKQEEDKQAEDKQEEDENNEDSGRTPTIDDDADDMTNDTPNDAVQAAIAAFNAGGSVDGDDDADAEDNESTGDEDDGL